LTQFYSYLWLRKDGTPYYAGKGSGRRAFKQDGHPMHIPKTQEGDIDRSRILVFLMDSEELAFESEKALIEFFGRINNGTGCLRNLTDGGEGASGCIPPLETRAKLCIARRKYVFTPEHRRKMSIAKKGHTLSPEGRMKVSIANRGRILSIEHRAQISTALKGRIVSPETRAKLSLANKGHIPWNKGKHFSKETRHYVN
jgi:hypothetical protein